MAAARCAAAGAVAPCVAEVAAAIAAEAEGAACRVPAASPTCRVRAQPSAGRRQVGRRCRAPPMEAAVAANVLRCRALGHRCPSPTAPRAACAPARSQALAPACRRTAAGEGGPVSAALAAAPGRDRIPACRAWGRIAPAARADRVAPALNFQPAAALAAVTVPNWAARPVDAPNWGLAPAAAIDLAREHSPAPELVPARGRLPAIARSSAALLVQVDPADQARAPVRAQELAPAAHRPATSATF